MELKCQADNSILYTNKHICIRAENIHRVRDAVYAKIFVESDGNILAYDTFNIEKDIERKRLADSAYPYLNGKSPSYPHSFMKHDIDMFCDMLPDVWEGRLTIVKYSADDKVEDRESILGPYILEGAGTIMFGLPASGKSYTLMAMGMSIAANNNMFWPVQQRNVLYINLERSEISVQRRFYDIAKVMRVKGREHKLEVLHCRGSSFMDISYTVNKWKLFHPKGVILIDSISRAGLGDLNSNETANKIIDLLNQYGTWVGIGHTPRENPGHIYGSVHFDAGQDIGIKTTAEEKDSSLNVALEVVKSSDIHKPTDYNLTFKFNTDGLVNIIMSGHTKLTNLQRVIAYMQVVGKATATEVSKALGIDRPTVSKIFTRSEFLVVGREGKNTYYATNV